MIKISYSEYITVWILKEGTSNLEVKLYDMRIFDTYIRCEDDMKNVIKFYKIECLNCKGKLNTRPLNI